MLDEKPPWVEELIEELRRVGRAAVAARAAAEACEETVESLGPAAPPSEARRILDSILPVCDALGRMAEGARVAAPPRGWLERLRESERTAAELSALREAVALLDAQLTSALESSGVVVDREIGGRVDPDRHRVVETRAPRARDRVGTVSVVIRPGYRLGEVLVREADVVAIR